MISADTNLFLFASMPGSAHHAPAQAFFDHHKNNLHFAVSAYVLVELYMNLRKPALFDRPRTAAQAADHCRYLRDNPHWYFADDTPGISDRLFDLASAPGFSYRRIIDARLALTLLHHGVKEFATANVKDFQGLGFERVWNPLEE